MINQNKTLFRVIDGGRNQLEAEIVKSLFSNRYDPAKLALLDRRGRLIVVHNQEKNQPDAVQVEIPKI
jgi:hypothetical protein